MVGGDLRTGETRGDKGRLHSPGCIFADGFFDNNRSLFGDRLFTEMQMFAQFRVNARIETGLPRKLAKHNACEQSQQSSISTHIGRWAVEPAPGCARTVVNKRRLFGARGVLRQWHWGQVVLASQEDRAHARTLSSVPKKAPHRPYSA